MPILKIVGAIFLTIGCICQAGDHYMTADRELKNYRKNKQKEHSENEET